MFNNDFKKNSHWELIGIISGNFWEYFHSQPYHRGLRKYIILKNAVSSKKKQILLLSRVSAHILLRQNGPGQVAG